MNLKIEKLSIAFPDWKMKDFSIELNDSSFTSLVGPSGCGKTTLMRLIVGLEQHDSGKIFLGARDVSTVPVEKRNIGLVFQNNSLFSHLNVFDNIAFGLKMKKQENIQKSVSKVLSLVHLRGFEKRRIDTLSGGEKKRVAIGRAIAFEPKILLLDEPFSGLDAVLKGKMKNFILELRKKTGLTMLMATHDIDDAFFLSDSIVVMNNGEIEQEGSPIEIFTKPKNSFVKKFVSDYAVAEAKQNTRGEFLFKGKLSIPKKKGKGRVFVSFKKSNYKRI